MNKSEMKTNRPNRQHLTEKLRLYMAELVACDTSDESFDEAVNVIEALTKRLKTYPRRKRTFDGLTEGKVNWKGDRFHYGEMLDFSPLSGNANPIAPPMNIYTKDQSLICGKVTFPAAFEGPPGLVHGGYIAAAFDEILGLAQAFSGFPGMTGTLEVHFRSPCPLNTELYMEGRVTGIEGRKKFTRATLHHGDQLIADGRATFIMLHHE